MMSPPNLICDCEIVGLIVQPQSIFLTFFSLTDKENVILNPEIRSVD